MWWITLKKEAICYDGVVCMSGKKRKNELLRVLVLSALLSTSYFGVAAAGYVLNGDTIEGTHELGALDRFYELDGDRKVTALSDVSVISKEKATGLLYIAAIMRIVV